MGLTFTDNFGPVPLRAVDKLDDGLKKATYKNALLLQANIIKGIRNQTYRSQWPDLKPKTKKRKAEKNLSSLLLVATGDMSGSFELSEENPNKIHVGTNNVYARVHEFGYAPRNIPARPYFRPAINDSVERMKENWIEAFRLILKS